MIATAIRPAPTAPISARFTERALVVADLEALGGDELYLRVLTNVATAMITAPLPSAKAR